MACEHTAGPASPGRGQAVLKCRGALLQVIFAAAHAALMLVGSRVAPSSFGGLINNLPSSALHAEYRVRTLIFTPLPLAGAWCC